MPVGPGAFERMPLGPFVAGRPPTRNGSLSMDNARPLTKDVQPATRIAAATQDDAAHSKAAALRGRPPVS
ncbi:hypothetical protein MPRS_43460 [Mycobacterium paraseoulense]|nr:hypothetical protein MPRS_43460 [Mycobacterium paraseoulense]